MAPVAWRPPHPRPVATDHVRAGSWPAPGAGDRVSALLVSAAVALSLGGSPAAATTVVAPRQSIPAAGDGARRGDTILVLGHHRENVAIGTDRVTLRGLGAVLEPPATPAANACFDPTVEGEAVHGVCVSGDIDFETGEISRYVHGVAVSGFTVRGFTGYGITQRPRTRRPSTATSCKTTAPPASG